MIFSSAVSTPGAFAIGEKSNQPFQFGNLKVQWTDGCLLYIFRADLHPNVLKDKKDPRVPN
jgi:hypothetical protein